MSKSVKVVALVAGLAAAGYVGGTWYMGKTVESAVGSWYDQAGSQLPYMKVISRDYNRSLFGATDDVVVQISKDYLKTMAEGSPDMMQAIDEIDPGVLELHIHSDIKHGPLPGAAPAAGRVLTTVNFSPEVRAKLDKYFGGKPPLQADTTIGFTGGGKTQVSSPPVNVSEEGATFDWAGLNATTDFANGFERYTLDATMPKFAMQVDGGLIEVHNIKVKADQKSTRGKAVPFQNEYDATVKNTDYPIHYSYFSHLRPPVPASQELSVAKYCYDAGNVNLYQAEQISKYYGIKALPAVVVDGQHLSSVSAGSILKALQ